MVGVCRTRKLLQSFKPDPTKPSSIETTGPVVNVKINLTENYENYGMHVCASACTEVTYFVCIFQVDIEGKKILVLLDVEFILCVQTYANSIYQKFFNPETNEVVGNAMQILKSGGQKPDEVKFEVAEPTEMVEEEEKRGFKLQGVFEQFAVALLDPEQSVEQVVILQVCI